MANTRLTEKADLDVMFEAEAANYKDNPKFLQHYDDLKKQFIEYYANCPSRGFEIDGKQVGGTIYDGKQVHVAVLPEYYGRWGLLLKPGLDWVFSIKDPMLVEVDVNNEKCLRFLDRNKWRRVKETDKKITYELTRNTPVMTRERKSKSPTEHEGR